MERTRGNLLRERESWSKRGPGFVVAVVVVVAWSSWRGRGRRGAMPQNKVILENEVPPFLALFPLFSQGD